MTSNEKPKCGGKRLNSDLLCTRPAGWGTNHPGIGRCKRHGGSTPTHALHAQREIARQAVATYGLPREIDPRDALLEEVYRTAGIVDWLTERIRALDPDALTWGTVSKKVDKQPGKEAGVEAVQKATINVWVEMHQRERRHLREVCRDAIAAGIEERRVKLAEQQGAMLAGAVRGILHDLGLSEQQWALVPEIVPRHLRALSAPDAAA